MNQSMKKLQLFLSRLTIINLLIWLPLIPLEGIPQTKDKKPAGKPFVQRAFYGKASYYANKFNGRRTANGEIFSQEKFTAACNVLPLGTWIRVTNLKNGKSVVVRTTDRLHTRMRRLVDLSRAAAKKLGYIDHGLARVKVEVLPPRKKSK